MWHFDYHFIDLHLCSMYVLRFWRVCYGIGYLDIHVGSMGEEGELGSKGAEKNSERQRPGFILVCVSQVGVSIIIIAHLEGVGRKRCHAFLGEI